MDALERGNTVEETDEAILRLGLPMAPSVLLQMVGPRVANHVLETLHEAYPGPLPALADACELRRRARRDRRRRSTPRAPSTRSRPRRSRRSPTSVGHLLDDGVVASADDIDTCLLLGAGLPFFLGGITKHLDQTGVSERVLGRPLAELGERVHA